MGSTPAQSTNKGDVAQLVEAVDLKSTKCGFDSHRPYHLRSVIYMWSFIIVFCVGMIFIAPFSKRAREMLKTGFSVLFIYLLGWITIMGSLILLSCFADSACRAAG